MCRTIKILISNWPRTRKFSQLLQAGKTVAFDFSHHGHTLVTLYVQFFFALIGQTLTGEFMRETYAASWNLFTLTAEADRVLCQLVMFLTFFPLDVQNEIQLLLRVFCYSWLQCSLFIGLLVEKFLYVACQSRKSDFGWQRLWNTAFCPRSVW